MSDSQAVEEQTTTVDGVTVTKRFETDEFPVPAIAFEFESTRETPVTLRVIDTVPEPVDVGDLGFHPETEANSGRSTTIRSPSNAGSPPARSTPRSTAFGPRTPTAARRS